MPPLTTLADDERLFRDSVYEFADREIRPLVRDMDEHARIAPALIDKLFGLGVMGIEIPDSFGGGGASFFHSVLAVEALSRVDPSIGVLVDVQNTLVINALLRWGSEDVHGRYLPRLASTTVGAYALSEAIGRMACLSFGCCYGKPLREASPRLARLFEHHHLVFEGSTKKASYASGLADEPLVPVQAITSVVFALAGLVGLAFFLAGDWRAAAIVPAVATWGWRALSELLRADHRGHSRISVYQWMALIAMAYLVLMLGIIPGDGSAPNLAAGLSQVTSVGVVVTLQLMWIGLFLFYGRSRVTGSVMSFHVVAENV
jgi:hypothetical protein